MNGMSHSELCRRACDEGSGPMLYIDTPPRRDIVPSPSSSWCGARAPVRSIQLPREVVSGGEFCANLQTVVSVCE